LTPVLPSSVSIVILNYNGEELLKNCLSSVLETDYPNFEVIVVDNASKDGSLLIANAFAPRSNLKIIPLEKNLGFSNGNNIGARNATGKYLVFLNNDTVVERQWLTELVVTLERNPDVGAVQSKLLFLYQPEKVQSSGNFIDSFGFTIPRIRLVTEKNKHDAVEIAATGAALMIRRDLFFRIGEFESNFFVYYEDSDLSWRVYLSGKTIRLVPTSIVYHAEGASLGSTKLAFRINLYIRNQLFTLLKNYSFFNGATRVLALSFLFIVGSIWLIFRRAQDLPLAVLAAPFQFLKSFPECWHSHLQTQLIRKVEDRQLLGSFLKPFDIKGLFAFYSSSMGYDSKDY
jgi:GT2 family glycosyltransferase